MSKDKHVLTGKTITGVYLAQDKGAIKFELEGQALVVANVQADCCSYTWIESLDDASALIGTVTEVRELDLPTSGNDFEGEYVQHYGISISTERGRCTIDYRNSSNGYYGGSLSWPGDWGARVPEGADWRLVAEK